MTNKMLITGGTGMVGKAVESFCPNAIFISSKDFDLRNEAQVEAMYNKYNPDRVIHLAAKVGGVKANSEQMADFYTDNILINTNVLKFAHKFKVKKVVSMLSTCVYPDEVYVEYPLTEDQLHLGTPHDSNYGYAYAKRMLDVQSRAYNKQYGTKFICAIPNNIFGEYDNFDLNNSHVIPAIIRKIWIAKHERSNATLWGDGSPLREFTYSFDIAKIILYLMWSVDNLDEPVNIGTTKEYSIKHVANKIKENFEFSGDIVWDTNMPSGQLRKPSSNQKLINLGFDPKTYYDFDLALSNTCEWFRLNYPNVRGVEE